MRRQRVPKIDGFFGFAARSDGKWFGHASMDNEEPLTNASSR